MFSMSRAGSYPWLGSVVLASAMATGAVWSGCGGQAFTGNSAAEDAGAEASVEASVEAGPDVVQDALPDVVIEAAPDALQDAKSDVTPDAAPDAVPDASPSCEDTPVPASDCTVNGNCTVQIFAPKDSSYNFGIVTDGQDVYWAAQNDYNGVGTGLIRRLAADQAGQAPVAFTTEHERPFAVEIGSEYIYWLAHGSPTTPPRLYGAARNCAVPCEPQVIKNFEPWSLNRLELVGDRLFVLMKERVDVLTGSALSWKSVADFPSGEYASIAPGFDGIFTSTVRNKEIMKLPLDGLSISPFVPFQGGNDSQEPGPTSMVASCSTLYALSIDRTLWTIDLTTKQQTALLAGLEGDLWGMGVDENFVYVNRANAGGVTRISRSTKEVRKFNEGSNVFTMAVDANYVYFDDHQSGGIYRIIK